MNIEPFFRLEISMFSLIEYPELEDWLTEAFLRGVSHRKFDNLACHSWKIHDFDMLVNGLKYFQSFENISYRLIHDLSGQVFIQVDSLVAA